MEQAIERDAFAIDTDAKAEWAARKIAEARAQRDLRIAHYRRQIEFAERECAREEEYLASLLRAWLETVPAHRTKTLTSYELPGGKVTLKRREPKYEKDDGALVLWMKLAGYVDLVRAKTIELPDWAQLKTLTETRGGAVVMRDTGEVVGGVTAVERGDELIVEGWM